MVSENTTFALGWQRNSNFHLMHFKIKTWEMCRWRTFLLPFLPAFWLQGNDLFLSKFSFEKEYISVRMEFATKRRKIYVEFPPFHFLHFAHCFSRSIFHLKSKNGFVLWVVVQRRLEDISIWFYQFSSSFITWVSFSPMFPWRVALHWIALHHNKYLWFFVTETSYSHPNLLYLRN